ncbi:MAG: hypothetical protein EXR60_04925 [Dehalococcoidia bacterium]|nr:hypothetical protein [Dehalococcoidia bacterium]
MRWTQALDAAFQPQVVAIIGASAEAVPGKQRFGSGNSFLGNYRELGFSGRLYAINPRAQGPVAGVPAFRSIGEVPEPVDLAVAAVPAPVLPGVLEECAAARVKAVHIYTAGFEETGFEEGRLLAARCREIIRRTGLCVIGPNGMGPYCPKGHIGPFDRLPSEPGPVAFISQSGGNLNWFSHHAAEMGVRFSKAVSFGNGWVLHGDDFLEYLAEDQDTRIICMYLEGIRDGRRLLELARRIVVHKPILLVKGGLTASGARAVASHTASLGGEAQVWDAFYKQTGVVRADSLEELADLAMTFLYVQPPRGLRAVLMGIGGGNSVLAADALAREGITLPALAPETTAELATFVPLAGSMVRNPLDIGAVFRGDLTLLDRTLGLVGRDPNVDIILAAPHLDLNRSSPEETDRLVARLSDYARAAPHGKPLALTFHSFSNDPEEMAARQRLMVQLPQRGVAAFRDLARAGRALARLHQYHRFLDGAAPERASA